MRRQRGERETHADASKRDGKADSDDPDAAFKGAGDFPETSSGRTDCRTAETALELRVREKMEWKIQRNRQRLAMQMEVFAGLSPMGKLNQGYAFVTGEDQQAVRSISGVRQGEHLTLYVRDGTIDAVVERTRKKDNGD